MQEQALRTVLLVKAVEEADREGMLIPAADRVAAAREAGRADGTGDIAADVSGAMLPARAQRLLADRARILRERLVARFPFVDAAVAAAGAPRAIGALVIVVALLLGFLLSALDGTRRINLLSLPLLGLVAWNLIVYAAIAVRRVRALHRRDHGESPLARWTTHAALGRLQRFVAKSAVFNAPLADALARFAREWYAAAKPWLAARAVRLFHLAAAAVGIGLIAGLYLRGFALDYRAGWESTWLDAAQAHAILSLAYGPASWLTGIPIPDAQALAAIRFEGAQGGESAARWIHLLAATALLFVVLPRALLAFAAALLVWRRARAAPLPASLAPYFRTVFGAVDGVASRGIVCVVPYAFELAPATTAALRPLLAGALGSTLAIDVRAPVRYGDEDDFVRALAERDASIADVIVLLFSLASTPEDENHGSLMRGTRDELARLGRPTQLLVLVDQRPYAARMAAQGGQAPRLDERRQAWERFVAARGLRACFVDLEERDPTAAASDAGRVRDALWQPAPT